jgi:YVTN family beta-propeller protein
MPYHRMPRHLAFAALFLCWPGTAARAELVYVANNSDNTVSVYDTATGTVTATIIAGNNANGIAITPNSAKAYVSYEDDGTVVALSTATNAVLATIQTGGTPNAAVASPDGSTVYIANNGNNQIEVIDTATDTLRTTVTAGNGPVGLAITPDGSTLYVANRGETAIQVISTSTLLTTTRITVGQIPIAVAVTPDGSTAYAVNGNFYAAGGGSVSVIDVATNAVTATIPVGNDPIDVAFTPDGKTAYVVNAMDSTASVIDIATHTVTATIGNLPAADAVAVTPDGKTAYVASSIPQGIVSAIDVASGQVISTFNVGAFPTVVAITSAPAPLVASILPGGRSVQTGTTATVFATMLNSGATALTGCSIALPASAPSGLSLSYQTTDPTTNALTGEPNTPVDIAGNSGFQTFVLSFDSAAALSAQALPLVFDCDGVLRVSPIPGVNTVDLIFSTTPLADIVALAATATNDGTVHLSSDIGAFAVAAVNVGITDNLTVTADTGDATLPVTTTLCQTTSAGQCLAPPAATVPISFAANATPTFSIFVSATAPVAFAPGTSRIFVRFVDAGTVSHGSTSVAVTTD